MEKSSSTLRWPRREWEGLKQNLLKGTPVGTPVEMACAAARSPADQDRWVLRKAGRGVTGLEAVCSFRAPVAPSPAVVGGAVRCGAMRWDAVR